MSVNNSKNFISIPYIDFYFKDTENLPSSSLLLAVNQRNTWIGCLLNGAIVRLRVRSKDWIDEPANVAANHTTVAWEMSATSRRHLVVMVTDASWINARAEVLFITTPSPTLVKY